jgi:hypothetical protein
MKINLKAVLELGTKGVAKAVKQTKQISDNLTTAAGNFNSQMNTSSTGRGAIDRQSTQAGYRGQRSVTGARAASGRNFSGLAGIAAGAGGAGDGLDGSLVGAYASLAANVFAVTAAFQALSDAAKVEQLTQGLELMGARGGVALKATARSLREVTDNAISVADSFRAVAQASSAGLGSEEIARLGAVARGASLALGRDASEAMDRLTRGAIKLEPELLDELGIMVRLDEAVREYAREQGKAASSLSLTERRQAFLNAVLAEGESKFGEISEQIEANPYDKLSASVRDAGTAFFTFLNNILKPIVELFASNPFALAIPGIFLLSKALGGLGVDLGRLGVNVDDTIIDMIGSLRAGASEVLGEDNFIFDKTYANTLDGLKESYTDLANQLPPLQKRTVLYNKRLAVMDARMRLLRASIGRVIGVMINLAKQMLPMIAMMAAFWVGGKILEGLNAMWMSFKGINKAVVEARKNMRELAESALQTFQSTESLSDPAAFDARINSLKELQEGNRKLIEAYKGQTKEQEKIDKTLDLTIKRTTLLGQEYDKNLDRILLENNISVKNRDIYAAQLALLSELDKQRALSILNQIDLLENEEETAILLEKELSFLEDITGTFKNINSQASELKKNMTEIIPRAFENSVTKTLDGVIAVSNEIASLPGPEDSVSNEALGSQLRSLGREQFNQQRAILNSRKEGNLILSNTARILEEIWQVEKDIEELQEKGTFWSALRAKAAEMRLDKLEEEAGIMAKTDAASVKAAAEELRLSFQSVAATEKNLALELSLLNARNKNVDAQGKLVDLQQQGIQKAIGGSGSEAGLVNSLASENRDLRVNINTRDRRKSLIDAEVAQQTLLLEVQRDLVAEQRMQAINAGDDAAIKSLTIQYDAFRRNIELIREEANLKKDAIDLEIRTSEIKVQNFRNELDALANGNDARREALKQSQQLLNAEKQLIASKKTIAELEATGNSLTLQRAVGPRGFTQAQQNTQAREAINRQIDNLKNEKDFLLQEHQFKLENLKLEKDIRDAELTALMNDPRLAGEANVLANLTTIQTRANEAYVANASIIKQNLEQERKILNLKEENARKEKALIPDSLQGRARQITGQISSRQINSLGLSGAALEFFEDEIRNGGAAKEVRKAAEAIQEATLQAEGFNGILGSIETGMTDAFAGIIDGSMTAKEAFASMANAILGQIAQMIAQMIAFKLIQSSIGGFIPGFANGGIIPMAQGGITNRGVQGVVSKPTFLVGEGRYNEAVVPLPNGNAIPVQMHGGNSSNNMNNVTVNVNVENGTASSEGQGDKAQKLGQMISSAVQKELMAQKQPGGLLSKYG